MVVVQGGGDAFFIGDVDLHGIVAGAQFLAHRIDFGSAGRAGDDLGARAGEAEGDRLAQPAGAAGDETDFSGDVETVVGHSYSSTVRNWDRSNLNLRFVGDVLERVDLGGGENEAAVSCAQVPRRWLRSGRAASRRCCRGR